MADAILRAPRAARTPAGYDRDHFGVHFAIAPGRRSSPLAQLLLGKYQLPRCIQSTNQPPFLTAPVQRPWELAGQC
jgi:hypothetical protein